MLILILLMNIRRIEIWLNDHLLSLIKLATLILHFHFLPLLIPLRLMEIKYALKLVKTQVVIPILIMLAHNDLDLLVTYNLAELRKSYLNIISRYIPRPRYIKLFKYPINLVFSQNSLDIHGGCYKIIYGNPGVLVVVEVAQDLVKIILVHI